MNILTLERQIQFAFLAAFLTLITISFFSYLSVNNLSEALKKEKQTQLILKNLSESLILTLNTETGERGYALTGNEIFLEPFDNSKTKLMQQIQQLRELLKDVPQQLKRIDSLETEINKKLVFIEQVINIRRNQGHDPALELTNTGYGKQVMDNIRSLIKEIEADELNTLEKRESDLSKSVNGTYWMLLIGSFAGVASIGLANLAIFRETVKRSKAEEELKEINKNLEYHVQERTAQLSLANDELRKNSEFVRTTLDSLAAHIAVVDKYGQIIVVNERWEKFAEENCDKSLPKNTGVGQNYLNVCQRASVKDHIALDVYTNLTEILNGEQQTYRVEYPCHSPTKKRWFILQINALKHEVGGAVISHFDISDRKKIEIELRRSEEFNRSIFDNSPDCVKVLEANGALLSMNKRGMLLMEIDDFKPFVGKLWPEFWEGEENQKAVKALETARQGETGHFEGYGKTAKGTLKYWDVSVNPIFSDGNKPLRMISTLRDITERKEVEREREKLLESEKKARQEAEVANRMRDEFLATISHELRAPLNSILGWGKILQQSKLDEETQNKAIETIVRNATAQNRLIEDLLDVSRIISGKVRLQVTTVTLNKLVEAALESVRPAAEAKKISLEVVEDAKVSHVSADPNRIQQVIWNLLSNAIKFTPSHGKVSVQLERLGSEVEIRVSDTGIGIKKEFLPHVFKRFSQADASSIRNFGGLGLGLAIVRHITEMHGGNVGVFSEGENKGATFTVTLPLIAAEQNVETPKSTQELKRDILRLQKNVNLNGILILVVDDEADSRQMLVQALTLYGATVITASSVKEALDEVNSKNPDVLISDIGMPEEDGYSLIRKVRLLPSDKAKIPALALTAFTRPQDRAKALNASFQDHISKPVEIEELVTVVAKISGRLPPLNHKNL